MLVGSGALEEVGVAVEPTAMLLSELPGRAAAAAAIIGQAIVSDSRCNMNECEEDLT